MGGVVSRRDVMLGVSMSGWGSVFVVKLVREHFRRASPNKTDFF